MVRTSGSRTLHPSSPPAAKRDDPPATNGGFASTTSKARPPARSATSRACRASHRRNRESPSRPRRSQPSTLTRQNASASRLVSTCVRGVVSVDGVEADQTPGAHEGHGGRAPAERDDALHALASRVSGAPPPMRMGSHNDDTHGERIDDTWTASCGIAFLFFKSYLSLATFSLVDIFCSIFI